ncbi:regulator of chromosome condensation 1/beta-lactamase-inhibitor protein II [Blastocladiella britannica]|nr:regulator of chromosome condensation 1/beta-lactamase-inhibitor protein II [Blastocladiella britannica]
MADKCISIFPGNVVIVVRLDDDDASQATIHSSATREFWTGLPSTTNQMSWLPLQSPEQHGRVIAVASPSLVVTTTHVLMYAAAPAWTAVPHRLPSHATIVRAAGTSSDAPYAVALIDSEGALWLSASLVPTVAWTRPELTGLDPTDRFVDIAAGAAHFLARTAHGRVVVWGRNHVGQFGDGDVELHGGWINEPRIAEGVDGLCCLAIACGTFHCVVMTDASVMTWGRASVGGLGHEGGQNAIDPAPIEMEDDLLPIRVWAAHGWTAVKWSDGRVQWFGSELPTGIPRRVLDDHFRSRV